MYGEVVDLVEECLKKWVKERICGRGKEKCSIEFSGKRVHEWINYRQSIVEEHGRTYEWRS